MAYLTQKEAIYNLQYDMSLKAYETSVLFLVTCMVAGAIASMYLKIFNMAPPLPTMAIHLPILAATIPIIIFRLRPAFMGTFAAFPIAFMILLALASFTWSEDPVLSLTEAIVFLILGAYFACVAWSYTWKRIISTMWCAMFTISLLSLFLFFAVPSLGEMQEIFPGALMGVLLEKNSAGQLGVFGAILALARIAVVPEKWASSLFSLFIFTAVLLLSTSKTSLIAYIISVVMFVWVFTIRRHPAMVGASLWATIFGGSALAVFITNNTASVFTLLGRNATFTGRAEIWRAVQVSLDDRPWRGHGYAAYWNDESYSTTIPWVIDELSFTPSHAHNSWVEISLGLGWFGSYALSAMLIMAFVFAFARIRTSNGAYFVIPFLIAATLIGTFESVLAFPNNFAGAVLLLVTAKVIKTPFEAEELSGVGILKDKIRAVYQHKETYEYKPADYEPVYSQVEAPKFQPAVYQPPAPQPQRKRYPKPFYRGPQQYLPRYS